MKKDKSMLDVAYGVLKARDNLPPAERKLPFATIYAEVAKILEMDEEEKKARISQFYTDLSFDGRFSQLAENFWDLRSNHTFKIAHDLSAIYEEVEQLPESPDDSEDGDNEDSEESEDGENKEQLPDDVLREID